jgi:murein DD-endopeptidase MepM/ murein hydrolase activator NlpD
MGSRNLLPFGLLVLLCVALLVTLTTERRNEGSPLPTATPTFEPAIEATPAALGNVEKVVIPDLRWPIGGPISSYYGDLGGAHTGIDIDSRNDPNQPVAAVADGTVIFAGGVRSYYYGLYVVIVSKVNGGKIEALYAHLDSLAVEKDQVVKKGEVIGLAGCTGYCTGTHLHFELIINGVRVNPLHFLP